MRRVYVMKSGQFYKIGSATNPQKRLKTFQTGNPQIELIYQSELMGNAYQVEKQLHDKFSGCSIGGEWFTAKDENTFLDEVRSIVKELCTSKKDAPANCNNASIHTLLDWIFAPTKQALAELEEENKKINEENESLKKKLIASGWTQEEIDALVENAERTA